MVREMEVCYRRKYLRKKVCTFIDSLFFYTCYFSFDCRNYGICGDTAFAGHLGEISVAALTTMGLLSPILSIYTAFQALFAVSTSIMIAKYLKEQKVREEYFITGICMTFIASAGVSICSYLIMPGLLSFIGAEGQIAILAEKYLRIQLFSNVFSALGYTLTSCIRAFGYPRIEMVFTGLVYGTLVSEVFCCFASLLWLLKHRLLWSKWHMSWRNFKTYTFELLKFGIAQTIIQSLAGCTAFFVNQSLLLNTTLNHVAAWNVVQKIYTLFLMPIVGITQGVQTIIAYFDGHQEKNKKKKTLFTTIGYTVMYGVVGVILVFFFGENISSLFASSDQVYQLGNGILRVVFSTFPLMGIFYTVMTLYEVTGHEGKAVFCAVPIADILAMLIALVSGNNKENKNENLSD